MGIKQILIIAIMLKLVISCTSDKEISIQQEPIKITLNLIESSTDTIQLSEIATKIEYIPLETAKGPMIGNIVNFALTK